MSLKAFFRDLLRKARELIAGVNTGSERKSEGATTIEPSDGYRVRLRVRMAKGLTTEEKRLSTVVAGREITITSQDKNESLNKTKWFVLHARGFSTEADALQFGVRLRSIMQIASLSLRAGVDVGEDRPTGWMKEQFARASGLIKDHERIAPNIHGLAVLPDDDLTRIPLVEAQGTVTSNPDDLLATLTELGDANVELSASVNALRLLNFALMTNEPLALMVLAFSAIEELGQNQEWSDGQRALIEQLATTADASTFLSEDERSEVAKAIRTGIFKLSLRQGVMRLLTQLDCYHLRKEWDRLYGVRSGLFHGTARLEASELNQAAIDTITLCGKIVLALVAKDGGKVPSRAKIHFPSN